MQIKTATFYKSSSKTKECPTLDFPEFVFIGRSNVGKSSLINMITNNKKLAKISGKPGKTLLINHYLINKEFFLIDLPGYGYSKISKKEQKKIDFLISDFFDNRKIQLLFILVDIRHEVQNIDYNFIKNISKNGINFIIIFTKADKLKTSAQNEKAKNYLNFINSKIKLEPEFIISSSKLKLGKKEILKHFFLNVS